MSLNKYIFNNVSLKKVSYQNRNGFIEVKLYDEHYNVIYKGKAKFNDNKSMKDLFDELKMKGANIPYDDSWL